MRLSGEGLGEWHSRPRCHPLLSRLRPGSGPGGCDRNDVKLSRLEPGRCEGVPVAAPPLDFTKESSLTLLGNAQNITEVVLSGVCHRYPELKFVSVENGAGWLPFLGEAKDWQWLNVGAHKEYPERLLPSEYLRRQIFGMYWFERESLRSVIDLLADNLMFETDFPHATSLSPGPASESPSPREVVQRSLGNVPDETAGKVLQHTATRLYHLEPPVRT